jgi:hypothetical protein
MWSCTEALSFGRRAVDVTVLRLGWSPRQSTTGLLPSRPLPVSTIQPPK